MLKSLATIAGLSLAVAAGTAAADDIQPHQFKVLGTWSSLSQLKTTKHRSGPKHCRQTPMVR